MASKNAWVKVIDFAIEELGAGEAIVGKIMEHAELTAEEVLAEADRMNEATFSRVTSHFAAEEQKRAAAIAELQQSLKQAVHKLASVEVEPAVDAEPKKDEPAPVPDGGSAAANAGASSGSDKAGSDELAPAPEAPAIEPAAAEPEETAQAQSAGDSQASGQ